jgi:hypothetical protein
MLAGATHYDVKLTLDGSQRVLATIARLQKQMDELRLAGRDRPPTL